MKKAYTQLLLLTVVCCFLGSQNSFATSNSGLESLKASLQPAGNHRFVYRMFFKLYDAAFYTNAMQTKNIDKLLNGENALLLEFNYLLKIKKSVILESSEKILPNNMTPADLVSIQERVDQINAVYRTVGKGDRSALSYTPGEGTILWINGEPMITIEGADFAQLYFRIWLGEKPISKAMRDALLQR